MITLTRAVRGTDRDISARLTTEKALLEDHLTLIKDFEKDPTLDTSSAKVNYLSDNGINEVFTGAGHFLMIQLTYAIEYFEDLS